MSAEVLAAGVMRDASPQPLRPTEPVPLGGCHGLWFVESGVVDVFLVPLLPDGSYGARTHLARRLPGEPVFGLREPAQTWELLAVGDTQASWTWVPWAQLQAQAQPQQLHDLLALWRQAMWPDWQPTNADPGGSAHALTLQNVDNALTDFHGALLRRLADEQAHIQQRAQERAAARERSDAVAVARAVSRIAGVLSNRQTAPPAAGHSDVLGAGFELLLRKAGVVPRGGAAGSAAQAADNFSRIDWLCRRHGVAWRQVELEGDWWRQMGLPLLAFTRDGNQPRVLHHDGRRYLCTNPASGKAVAMDAVLAASLAPRAVMIYRTFPTGTLSLQVLLRFGLLGTAADLRRILMLGALGGLLGLLVPMATGLLINTVIPTSDRVQLSQMAAMLVIGALATAAFEFTRAMAVQRVGAKLSPSTQAALMHRLLHMPAAFFKRFGAGDLAQRGLSADAVVSTLVQTAQSAVLSWLFGLASLAYLFFLSPKLAMLACALVLIALVFTLGLNLLRVRLQRSAFALRGEISSLVLQLLTGINKLRGAGAEARAFARWADAFTRQKEVDLKLRGISTAVAVFDAGYTLLCPLLVFGVLVFFALRMSVGDFLAFQNSFGQFLGATLGLGAALTSAFTIVPLYERARPILQTSPELDEHKREPGVLQGKIELSRLRFRYAEDSPWVLDDVSIQAEPGEFVALVGASGSGKSTLLRLLLGFEKPASGGVFLDGKELSGLDVTAVRRQFGVVLQSGKLVPGDIRTNVAGSAPTSLEDVWAAVEAAGLRADIEAMPMGLQTFVSESGGTISGGQRQRLMVARALVKRPRILLFDEATSALDNQTQAIVAASVARLRATRIVIAHRLSTIVDADRIYVLERGKVVESGNYAELMARNGAFAELARRQIA